jgi:glyoxylase-like metal-dependent hydrolase (beta-lactamase superfamily II)
MGEMDMKIAEGLALLEIPISEKNVMYPVLVWDDRQAVLFDAGLPRQADKFVAAIEAEGVPFDHLAAIILTHQDMDHIGSLSDLQKMAPGQFAVMAYAEEIPFIQFDQVPSKMTPEFLLQTSATQGIAVDPDKAARIRTDPDAVWPALKTVFAPFAARVDTALSNGEELPFCGGIIVIHTPGHTPGHCCYYLKRYNALVAGDALNIAGNLLVGPNPVHSVDISRAIASLAKLGDYAIETVLCYHGGMFIDQAAARIAELARG